MKNVIVLIFLLPLLANAQTEGGDIKNNGIDWTTALSWNDIKEKAKKENKYIFVDAFATWCGPCKKMDKEVYINDSVGRLMNQRFISVKVQMDKTDKDNSEVISWYSDAQKLKRQFLIRAFPTMVFLSPNGEVVSKIVGFRNAKTMVATAEKALTATTRFTDPKEEEYFLLAEEYESEKKNYSNMPLLYKRAKELSDNEMASQVSKEYRDYLKSREEKEWYSKPNIEFLASHILTSSSPFYKMWTVEAKKVDNVMGKKGYAESILDGIIQREIAFPYLGIPKPTSGKRDTSEANWDGLYEAIKVKYGEGYADRNMADARLSWYEMHLNYPKRNEYLILYLNRFGLDAFNDKNIRSFGRVNDVMWDLFRSSKDSSVLLGARIWMREVVNRSADHPNHFLYLDTYANLLYKAGQVTQAIKWEQKALQIVKYKQSSYFIKEYEMCLSKMEKGKPTW